MIVRWLAAHLTRGQVIAMRRVASVCFVLLAVALVVVVARG